MTERSLAPTASVGLLGTLLIGAIEVYRITVSSWLGPGCRYDPSCSRYAIEAITRYGALRGSWLAVKRIGRCHPLGGFGYDPVP